MKTWTMQVKLKNGFGHPEGEWKDVAPSGGGYTDCAFRIGDH